MKRTGFIAILGKPNAGKSTLLNAMIGEKVAIVSSKPQTTRNRITGILTRGEDQMVFMDTPGMHIPQTKLGNYMMGTLKKTMGEVDAAIFVVEAEPRISGAENAILEHLRRWNLPAILAVKKTDRSTPEKIAQTIALYAEAYDFAAVVPISALHGKQVETVLDEARAFLSESEWFFPEDMITDQPERRIAAEIIREKLLRLLADEVPHGTAVVVEDFTDETTLLRIRAEIYCERESHKGIIIGKQGTMLGRIGSQASEDI